MKRSREVSIIVEALVANSLLDGNRTDKARFVIKEAIKEIRRERYQKKRPMKQEPEKEVKYHGNRKH